MHQLWNETVAHKLINRPWIRDAWDHTHTHDSDTAAHAHYALSTARGEELKVPITPLHKHTRVPDARSARSNTRSSAHALLFWAIEIFWSSLSLPLRDALNHCFSSYSGNSDEYINVRVFLKISIPIHFPSHHHHPCALCSDGFINPRNAIYLTGNIYLALP